jgi:NAD-dependent deacetylase
MIPSDWEAAILQAGQYFKEARHAVVITGAGISVPSGIPDFRSPESGLWAQNDPMEVASLTAFRHRPEVFFNWLRPLAQKSMNAKPNLAHLALAELEKAGHIRAVITQNIDGLHQQAGSQRVIEVHGSMRTFSCLRCKKSFPFDEISGSFLEDEQIPHCPSCQTVIKPDVILYEEGLEMKTWLEAVRLCERADLLMVIGSSLVVMPVGELPFYSLKNKARFIINTLSPTHLDDVADLLLRCDATTAIPGIASGIL